MALPPDDLCVEIIAKKGNFCYDRKHGFYYADSSGQRFKRTTEQEIYDEAKRAKKKIGAQDECWFRAQAILYGFDVDPQYKRQDFVKNFLNRIEYKSLTVTPELIAREKELKDEYEKFVKPKPQPSRRQNDGCMPTRPGLTREARSMSLPHRPPTPTTTSLEARKKNVPSTTQRRHESYRMADEPAPPVARGRLSELLRRTTPIATREVTPPPPPRRGLISPPTRGSGKTSTASYSSSPAKRAYSELSDSPPRSRKRAPTPSRAPPRASSLAPSQALIGVRSSSSSRAFSLQRGQSTAPSGATSGSGSRLRSSSVGGGSGGDSPPTVPQFHSGFYRIETNHAGEGPKSHIRLSVMHRGYIGDFKFGSVLGVLKTDTRPSLDSTRTKHRLTWSAEATRDDGSTVVYLDETGYLKVRGGNIQGCFNMPDGPDVQFAGAKDDATKVQRNMACSFTKILYDEKLNYIKNL